MENQRSTDLIADSNKMVKTNAAGLIFLLPGEIIIDILSRLPVDSVMQCKLVCQTWRSLLVDHDPLFLALHTHRFMINHKSVAASRCFFLYVNQSDRSSRLSTYRLQFGEYDDDESNDENKYDAFTDLKLNVKLRDKPTLEKHYHDIHKNENNRKIILSCNGLILIASSNSTLCNSMMVFNPVTKEYLDLPPSGEEEEDFHEHSTSTGFGYHPITKEYKIVRIKYLPAADRHRRQDVDHARYIYVYIYTLGRSSSWSRRRREILKVENNSNNNNKINTGFECNKGVVLNGVVHWIVNDRLLLFDLADEELKLLPLPPPERYEESPALGVLGGCLCFCRCIDIYTTEIWVLSKHKEAAVAGNEDEKEKEKEINSYANSCSWTKKFSIREGKSRFVSALENSKLLLLCIFNNHEYLHFVFYDPKTQTGHYRCCSLDGLNNRPADIIPYVKSFVSLKALGEEDAKILC